MNESKSKIPILSTFLIYLSMCMAAESIQPCLLTEIMRIPGTGIGYIMNRPEMIKPDGQGGILVSGSKQLLHFDKSGKFIADHVHLGEGPGEIKLLSGFFCDSQLTLASIWPTKLIVLDQYGSFLKEIRIRGLENFPLYAFK